MFSGVVHKSNHIVLSVNVHPAATEDRMLLNDLRKSRLYVGDITFNTRV